MRFLFAVVLTFASLCSPALAQPYEGPDTLWTRLLYGPDHSDYILRSLHTLPNQTFLCTGTCGVDWIMDYFAQRLDGNGTVLETRVYQSIYPQDTQHWGRSCLTPDSGFALVGRTNYGHIDLVRCDASLDTLWWRRYDFWGDGTYLDALCLGLDGGFLLGGNTIGSQGYTIGWRVLKVDDSGDTLWSRLYPPVTYRNYDYLEAVAPVPGIGYVLAGGLGGTASIDPTLMVIDSTGEVLLTRRYGTVWQVQDYFYDVAVLADGYLLAGESQQNLTSPKFGYLVRTNWQGDTLWTRSYRDSSSSRAWLQQIRITADSNVTVVGYAEEEMPFSTAFFLLRLTPAGDLLWQRQYPLWHPNQSVAIFPLLTVDAGGHYLFGSSIGEDAGFCHLQYTAPDTTLVEPDAMKPARRAPPSQPQVEVYPNPFNSATTLRFSLSVSSEVQFTLHDVLGRKVFSRYLGRLPAGEHTELIHGRDLSSGVYFVSVQAGQMSQTRKVLLIR